jgi:hypothetical protein
MVCVACASPDKPAVVGERPCPVLDASQLDAPLALPLDDASSASSVDASAASDAAATDPATITAAHVLALKPVALPAGDAHEKSVVTLKAVRASENLMPGLVIVRIVRQNFGRMRMCFENFINAYPTVRTAEVTTFFAIGSSGDVAFVDRSDSPDSLAHCMERTYAGLSYPRPDPPLMAAEVTMSFDATAIPPRHGARL